MFKGKRVVHGKYGSGEVIGISEGRIHIVFDGEEKAFPYPDSFERFLRFEEEECQNLVNGELEGRKNADAAALRERTIQFKMMDLERRKERKEKAERARKAAAARALPVTEARNRQG